MKSIRVSLIVYFLVLLAAGLGVASVSAYGMTAAALRAKQKINNDLLNSQYDSERAQILKRFDDDRRRQAYEIARVMAAQNQWSRPSFLRISPVALIGQPQAHLASLLWAYEATPRTSLNVMMSFRLLREVTYSEIDLPHSSESGEHEYYQINANWSQPWRSRSLGSDQLPYDEHSIAHRDFFDPVLDDLALSPNRHVRRVQLRVPATRVWRFGRQGPSGGNRAASGNNSRTPPPAQPATPPPERVEYEPPWLVIHCAADTSQRDAALNALTLDLSRRLDAEHEDAQTALRQLQQRLIWTSVAVFLGTALGAYVLLGIGLAPLRRLSDAVSRVSPRDFKLPLDNDQRLGAELAPVAGRLRETLDQLRRVFEREKQAAADISHELRTPVASLLTTLDVALRKPRSAEDYRRTLVDCRAIGQQMRQLVERLMALARLDAGSDHVQAKRIDIGDLVEEVSCLVKPLAAERGLDLRVECPHGIIWTTDPDKLREILVNLLHNAIQYNRPEGSIDVSAVTENGWLDLRVRDTGIGIAPETSERIFERFYRADPSRNDSGLHAGLGLSIVKGYVGLLGGTVTVESRAGHGSTFHVRLPKNRAA